MAEFIKMHGPALDGSGEIHETEVHAANVKAFEASGWSAGPAPSSPEPEPAEEPAPEPDPQPEEEQPAEEPKKKPAKKRRK